MEESNNKTKKGMRYGLVCFLDALGTKGIWGFQEVEDYIDKLLMLKSYSEEIFDVYMSDMEDSDDKDLLKSMEYEVSHFSDTFIITLTVKEHKGETDYAVMLAYFAQIIADILSKSFFNEVFFRGAISQGYAVSRESMFVGPAVDDAAYWYERADWLGVMLTPTASLALKAFEMISPSLARYVVEYKVPIKDNHEPRDVYAVNWLLKSDELEKRIDNPDKVPVEGILYRRFSGKPIPEFAYKKYLNTIDFMKKCREHNEELKNKNGNRKERRKKNK